MTETVLQEKRKCLQTFLKNATTPPIDEPAPKKCAIPYNAAPITLLYGTYTRPQQNVSPKRTRTMPNTQYHPTVSAAVSPYRLNSEEARLVNGYRSISAETVTLCAA